MAHTVVSDLVFATIEGVDLKADLYRPTGPGPHPILVAAAGGAWRRGDRSQLAHWGHHLADQGIAVFSIDYRRSVNGKIWPSNLEDVVRAVDFVRARAASLCVDAGRLGLLGASAGAHLAALAALRGNASAQPPIRVLVGIYGVYDLAAHWRADVGRYPEPGDDPTERMMGATPVTDPNLYADASPILQIRGLENKLKVFLSWGEADTDVLPAQSQAFADALRGKGVSVESLPISGAGHFWFSKEGLTLGLPNSQVAPRLVAFLRRHLT